MFCSRAPILLHVRAGWTMVTDCQSTSLFKYTIQPNLQIGQIILFQVGRVEDVVVSDEYRGRQLGKFFFSLKKYCRCVEYLTDLLRKYVILFQASFLCHRVLSLPKG